jgi:hypothetical protein
MPDDLPWAVTVRLAASLSTLIFYVPTEDIAIRSEVSFQSSLEQ